MVDSSLGMSGGGGGGGERGDRCSVFRTVSKRLGMRKRHEGMEGVERRRAH